jgi:hypothetical protein
MTDSHGAGCATRSLVIQGAVELRACRVRFAVRQIRATVVMNVASPRYSGREGQSDLARPGHAAPRGYDAGTFSTSPALYTVVGSLPDPQDPTARRQSRSWADWAFRR